MALERILVVVAGDLGDWYVCGQPASETGTKTTMRRRSFASPRLHMAVALGWLEGTVQWCPLLLECV